MDLKRIHKVAFNMLGGIKTLIIIGSIEIPISKVSATYLLPPARRGIAEIPEINVGIPPLDTSYRGYDPLIPNTAVPKNAAIVQDKQRKVNVAKYKAANPLTPISNVDRNAQVTIGKQLGAGGLGVVYEAKVEIGPKQQAVVAKQAKSGGERALAIEADAGRELIRARANLPLEAFALGAKNHLISDVQGLEAVVIPIRLANGTLIQERIQGMDGLDAIYGKWEQQEGGRRIQTRPPMAFYANGFVADTRDAVLNVAEIALGLVGIHKAGLVHSDLKLENTMVAQIELSSAEVNAKIIEMERTEEIDKMAKARLNFSPNVNIERYPYWRGIFETKKEEIKRELRATPHYRYEFRIIDLGLVAKSGEETNGGSANGAPEVASPRPGEDIAKAAPDQDIFAFGTMLPSLLFGKAGSDLGILFFPPSGSPSGQPSRFVAHYRGIEDRLLQSVPEYRALRKLYTDRCKYVNSIEIKNDRNIYNQQRQLQAQRQEYNDYCQWFNQEQNKLPPRKRQEWMVWLRNEHQQIIEKERDLANTMKQAQSFHNSTMAELSKQKQSIDSQVDFFRKRPEVQDKVGEQMRTDIFEKFRALDCEMYNATGKYYPKPILKRLAYMKADCSLLDPPRRPSAEQITLALQNMGLADWRRGQYNIQNVPQPEPGSDAERIQRQFPWINGTPTD
ncbi:MAG: hypothetical protein LBS71_01170 [Puniceicoccales bacterium]|jgi:serine/threonine protein kinase|nr:hypothetical protein [Puniceicoccales bacterium]